MQRSLAREMQMNFVYWTCNWPLKPISQQIHFSTVDRLCMYLFFYPSLQILLVLSLICELNKIFGKCLFYINKIISLMIFTFKIFFFNKSSLFARYGQNFTDGLWKENHWTTWNVILGTNLFRNEPTYRLNITIFQNTKLYQNQIFFKSPELLVDYEIHWSVKDVAYVIPMP